MNSLDSDELADKKNNNIQDGEGLSRSFNKMTPGGGDTTDDLNTSAAAPSLNCDHEHFPVIAIDEVFKLNIDDMFSHLFSDSKLFNVFLQQRNTYDVRLDDWVDSSEGEAIKVRTIHYTLSINYSIGPKCSPSTEVQRMLPGSKAGQSYVIDADCMNGGVPYADSFYTTVRYCISKINATTTRLHVSGKVVYRKKMLGLIKNFIEKTAHSGIKVSFAALADLLRLEADGIGPSNGYKPNQSNSGQSSKAGQQSEGNVRPAPRRTRRRLQQQRSVGPDNHISNSYMDLSGMSGEKSEIGANEWRVSSLDILTWFLVIMVLFLLCFHIILYNQLTTLELLVQRIQNNNNSS